MSLRTAFLAIFVLLLALLASLAVIAQRVLSTQAEIRESADRRLASWRAADELRQSSDDLTRMARTFVETSDERYAQYYRQILDIRNGEAPRPANYDTIYWDLVQGGLPVDAETVEASALLDRMRALAFTEVEFAKLAESQERSDALVEREREAMQIVRDSGDSLDGDTDAEMAKARALVFDQGYHRAKAEIMAPINEFLKMVDDRTATDLAGLRSRGRSLGHLASTLALVALGISILAFFWFRRRIILPVQGLSSRMADIAGGERDLRQRVAVRGDDEIGALSGSFNTFIDKLHETIVEVADSTQIVARTATRIASASKQQQATAATFGEATSDIASAVHEMSGTSKELASDMGVVAETATRSAASAAAGRQGLEGIQSTIAGILEATEAVGEGFRSIRERAEEITGVVTTITQVADQTNLLSVNAAIESEKAGEAGRGFRVVAREVRRLADETAAATLEIEQSVAQMQSAVSGGVMQMDRLAGQVRTGAAEVSKIADRIAGIIEGVEVLTQRFGRLNEGMAHQTQGLEQIRGSMEALRAGARETLDVQADFARSAFQLEQAVSALRDQVGQFQLEESV